MRLGDYLGRVIVKAVYQGDQWQVFGALPGRKWRLLAKHGMFKVARLKAEGKLKLKRWLA